MSENIKLEDEKIIDIDQILNFIWDSKITIITSIFIVSIMSVIYALSVPNIYTSKALLAPSQNESGANSSLRAYSGLASFAGVNLPSSDSMNTLEAIEKLKSLKFYEENILPFIKLEDVMAISYWEPKSNKIIYDTNIFDDESWVRNVNFPKKRKPSAQESHKLFIESNFSIELDDLTGFITVSVRHHSPNLASDWLEIIIKNINEVMRKEQKQQSLESVNFINKQISQTNYTEVKQALSSILQRETEKLMLIEANEDYVFKTIEPPYSPEERSSPNRALICIFGALFGAVVGVLLAFFRKIIIK